MQRPGFRRLNWTESSFADVADGLRTRPAAHRQNPANHCWMVPARSFPIMASQRIRRSVSGIDNAVAMVARHAVDIVRIDQQRGIELIRGAGEFRQHQHAGIGGILRGDIFLGDEIHAVMQRRHQADLRRAIEACQHGLAESLVEIADRRPVHFAMAAIDVADEFREFALQIAIGFDGAARGVAICNSDTVRFSAGCRSACGRRRRCG